MFAPARLVKRNQSDICDLREPQVLPLKANDGRRTAAFQSRLLGGRTSQKQKNDRDFSLSQDIHAMLPPPMVLGDPRAVPMSGG